VTTLAICHPGGLLGKELRETLGRGEVDLPWTEVRLLSTRADEIGMLTEVGGTAAIVQRYEPNSLEGVDAAFFCGPAAANRPLLAELPAGVTAVLLSTDAEPADGHPVVAGVNEGDARGGGGVLLSPHPAVVLIALLVQALAELEPLEVVATLVQPASLHDDPGLEELFEQSRQIIAMTQRQRPKVFGAQLAFNLLPAAAAVTPIGAVEKLVTAVLAKPLPVAVQIVQGGIFHCLAASLYVRCPGNPAMPALRKLLRAAPHLAFAEDPAHLGPVDAAAGDKVLLGPPRRDARGFWIWAVMDNLTRGGALNAIAIARAAL
jgi:aspartate-semialdehyde dehydrogenase